MVNEKEMRKLIKEYENKKDVHSESYRFRDSDIIQTEKDKRRLPFLISERKLQNDEEHNVGATKGYDLIGDMCLIAETTFKKTVNSKIPVTRKFLYKFVVGLKMSIEEANKFFSMCGGTLKEDNPEDLLCIRALEDGDSIYDFCNDYEKYFGKITRERKS